MLTTPSPKNPVAYHGYYYFLTVYGLIRLEKCAYDIPDIIFPSNPPRLNDTITGWVTINSKDVPIFEEPENLTGLGDPILIYKNKVESYPCAVRRGDVIHFGFDIFTHLGWCLSGNLEKVMKRAGNDKNKLIQIPFLDYYSDFLYNQLLELYSNKKIPLVQKSFWPDTRSFAVCLTHDVDEVKKKYQWITRPARLLKSLDFNGIYHQCVSLHNLIKGQEPYWTFDNLVGLEKNLGVRSSLYFLDEDSPVNCFNTKTWRHYGRRYNWGDPKVRSLLISLHNSGWEVGLHGSFHSFKNKQKIIAEKLNLENVIADRVWGGRQHNLNLKIPDTWIIQEEAGLMYDTTLGYNSSIGFRWGTCHPFHPFNTNNKKTMRLLEIPLIIEDLPFFRLKNDKKENIINIIREIQNQQGVLTLLWHHSVFNKHEYPGWSTSYEKIIRYCQSKNAWITTAKSVAQWFISREKTEFYCNYNKNILKIFPVNGSSHFDFTLHIPNSMNIYKSENAEILTRDANTITLRTPPLSPAEHITIEFRESFHGN